MDLSYSTDNSQSDWPVQKGLREGKKELSFYRFTHDMLQKRNTVQTIVSSGNVRNQCSITYHTYVASKLTFSLFYVISSSNKL